jgi:predicted transcriptional regulator
MALLPEISDIKRIRDIKHMSLSKFAKKYGVNKSWLYQVEKKDIEPSYSKIKKIFDMLESEKYEKELTAEELCITDMISFEIGEFIEDANKIMIKNGISQIPVFEKNNCVGMITDKTIMNLIESSVSKIPITRVILEDKPITVPANHPLSALRRLLDYYEYLLVEKNGFIYGILVRQDIMQLLGK